jgi:hypothetical protein
MGDERSRFWRFEIAPRAEFERGDCMPFDPIMGNWHIDMNGPLVRFSLGHCIESTHPKVLFVCWRNHADGASGWIEYDQPVWKHTLLASSGPSTQFTVASEIVRSVPQGYFHQKRVNDYDTMMATYPLTQGQAEGIMARGPGEPSSDFPNCRGELCWCYDCAMDSVDGYYNDEDDHVDQKKLAAKRYATYVKGRYLEGK